jgi:hypothetical protein
MGMGIGNNKNKGSQGMGNTVSGRSGRLLFKFDMTANKNCAASRIKIINLNKNSGYNTRVPP